MMQVLYYIFLAEVALLVCGFLAWTLIETLYWLVMGDEEDE